MLCSDFAQITFVDQKGDPMSDVGLLEDVSAGGITISLSVPLPISMRVRIHTKGFEGDAIVRHTELGDYGFLVGLEFADGYEWDRQKWTPDHLLAIPPEQE
jgi:hypothetical protein